MDKLLPLSRAQRLGLILHETLPCFDVRYIMHLNTASSLSQEAFTMYNVHSLIILVLDCDGGQLTLSKMNMRIR